jgi:hypothetical protein
MKRMRAVAAVILVFGVLAYDLTSNNGRWLHSVKDSAHDIMREVGLQAAW